VFPGSYGQTYRVEFCRYSVSVAWVRAAPFQVGRISASESSVSVEQAP
jgi:hypothetical protein